MTRAAPYLAGLAILAAAAIPAAARAQQKICIDPGHGGSDPGAVGVVQEAFVNLDIALRLRDLLLADNDDTSCGGEWTILMTRDTDVFVSLSGRSSYANANNADRFMSIHNNAFNGSAHGTETYSYQEGTTSADLRCHIQPKVVEYLGTTDRGCKTANFHVIRETNMPATLSECAFVDHAGDGAILDNPDMRQEAARAHLHALQAHYGLEPCDPGAVEPFPLMELDVQADAIEDQEPDFCIEGESQDIFDITSGQSTFYRVFVTNNGTDTAGNVKLGIFVEEPYLEILSYTIYDNAHSDTCGEEWCVNDSNDNSENPAHDDPGSSFILGLYSIAVGETKMIELKVEAMAFSILDSDHPDVRAWVNHIDGTYDKEAFDSGFTDSCSCQTFNGGDLRAYFESDVFSEEICDGVDNNCDGEVDEEACVEGEDDDDEAAREPVADKAPDEAPDEPMDGDNGDGSGYTATSACGCAMVR